MAPHSHQVSFRSALDGAHLSKSTFVVTSSHTHSISTGSTHSLHLNNPVTSIKTSSELVYQPQDTSPPDSALTHSAHSSPTPPKAPATPRRLTREEASAHRRLGAIVYHALRATTDESERLVPVYHHNATARGCRREENWVEREDEGEKGRGWRGRSRRIRTRWKEYREKMSTVGEASVEGKSVA